MTAGSVMREVALLAGEKIEFQLWDDLMFMLDEDEGFNPVSCDLLSVYVKKMENDGLFFHQLFIEFSSADRNLNGSIELLSISGQTLKRIDRVDFRDFRQTIDMGTLPKGVYFIKINTNKGTVIEKVIRS